MRQPLLLQYYQLLPDQNAEDVAAETKAFRKGLLKFKRSVEARYNEGTLEKLLDSSVVETRRAAVQALGLVGSMAVNPALAARLHDEDLLVRRLADEALWSLWFRADAPENNEELKRLTVLPTDQYTPEELLARFNALIRKAPRFAEVYNQRAVFHFRLGNFAKAIADCEKVLRLNPHHFGAASGMGQCFLKQRKLRAALRIYRRAARINPNLDGVQEAIESLEKMLGEEGKR